MIRFACGEQVFEADVRETPEGLEVALGGEVFRFALRETEPGVFLMANGRRAVGFHLARQGEVVHLSWEGAAYALRLEPEGTAAAHRQDHGALEAPMPGKVVAVRVSPGQKVAKGEELLVVEAMKMENALRSPRAGVVRAVRVAPGDMVAPGSALVEVE
jgi:biotin carboxyl carrier protein